MDIMSIFSERLNDLIFEKKLTSEIFAKEIGIDISNIYRYLRRESVPVLGNAIKIADYFNCSLDFLFGIAEENYSSIYKPAQPFNICFKHILEKNNYSRYRVHKDTGISDQRLDDWYHGIRVPTVESLIVISKYFDCSLDYLVGRGN